MTTGRATSAVVAALAVCWWAAYQVEAWPFFPVIGVGAAIAAAGGWWLRRRLPAPPPLRATLRLTALAMAVAVAHWLVARGLFAVAEAVAPWATSDTGAVLGRVAAFSVVVRAVVAGALIAPLEELFWRGAFHPWVADRIPGPTGHAAAVGAYTVFHAVTLHPPLVAAAALGGLVWGGLLVRTRSVGAVMVAHGLWTTLTVLAPPG